ncbi:hypothetical protein Ocepr_2327 (plasmid) [Oceanithermus profundus DSM 14977]|uniref:Uncharacterized protein n=1 Tax=Oceanithermus profundus (strain DSM 14977 / NBRC 100410 / VKM B-2274 / 506) TaxID=670487 RepID=E4UAJ6_OCEP5|nr:hypothetical protein [Oceanithermus profundus]ADR37775.1 hypothetical protein Ocepr_2327 [Oceanithermus profundus DSM 14977]
MKKPKKSRQEREEGARRRFLFAHRAKEEEYSQLLIVRVERVSGGVLFIVEAGAIPVRERLKALGFGWDARREEWRHFTKKPVPFLEALKLSLPEGWEVRTYEARAAQAA